MLHKEGRCRGAFPRERIPSSRRFRSLALWKRQAGRRERSALPYSYGIATKIRDFGLEEFVKVEPRLKADQCAAEPDRRTIHKHKFSRWPNAAQFPEFRVYIICLLQAIFGRGNTVIHQTRAIIQQRRKNKSRPHVHDVHKFGRNGVESPSAIGLCCQNIVPVFQGAVEVDHASHERCRKRAYATEIEKINAVVSTYGVIAEMRIPVNNTVPRKRAPPGPEECRSDPVSDSERSGYHVKKRLAFEPRHREQTLRRQLHKRFWHSDVRAISKHRSVEAHMRRLAQVIELLFQTCLDLFGNFACVDCTVEAALNSKCCF